MKPLRRSTCVGAVLSFLVLTAPVDGAAAAVPEDPRSTHPQITSVEPQGRKVPSEPTGRAASLNAMRSGRLSCGDVITRSTTLTADVGPCRGTGIIIGANNIMLNLNGHTISGIPEPGSGNDAGIRLPNRSGVRVTGLPGDSGKKGTITGFDAGVVVNGGSGNTIENLSARDNVAPAYFNVPLGDGIAIFESANNRILNNDVIGNGHYDGIAVLGLGADNNLIEGNLVAESFAGDFSVGGAGIVINNFLDVNTRIPIRGNKVLANTIRDNPASGISNIANVDGVIARNRVERNGQAFYGTGDGPGHGIGVQGGPGLGDHSMRVVVEDNITNENGISGIILIGPTDDNVVRRNDVFRNGFVGIMATPEYGTSSAAEDSPNNNLVIENRTGHNLILDLVDTTGGFVDCGTNEWFGNTWGPLMPLTVEFGFTTMYFPDCTAAGGSGPDPTASG